MPNTNFVPNWTFERTLPSPFDSYSGKSAVMKDIASKYCNQPKKRATLHSATLQAVFSYMNLENPPAGKAEEELGAIGSQANNFTIAEYPSRTGLLHVVVYNRMTGKFIAGKYEKPLDLDSKPEPYQFKKDEDSGSALYFALMPTFLSDDEFNEKYQELKQHRDDGFPDLPKAAETAAVLCDNVYRRIRYGDSLPIGNIKVDTPANGVLQRLTPLNIQKGVYAPTEIIQGTFQVLKGGHHYTASAVSIPKEDFVDKYILSNSRTLTPQEESTVPILEDWYVIPKEIQRICEHAKLTTDSKQPMRNFMLRGPAGTGKTEGAKAIAAGLHLPYRCITCSANTEIFDGKGRSEREGRIMKRVITYGTFDLFHQGHYNILKRARELGDYLIVGVTSESYDIERGKLNVQDSLLKRIENVRKTGFADEIIVEEYQGQKLSDITKYNIDLLVVGSDWRGKFDYLKNYCQVVYLERTKNISSTKLRSEGTIYRVGIVTDDAEDNGMVLESKFVSGLHVESVYSEDIFVAREFCDRYELDSYGTDYGEFLNGLDIIYIKSGLKNRAAYIRHALEQNKYVISDTPMTLAPGEMEELFALAKEHRVVLVERLTLVYLRAFTQLVWLTHGALVGDVIAVKCAVSQDDFEGGKTFNETVSQALCACIKLLGSNYLDVNTNAVKGNNGEFIYDMITVRYPKALATIEIGTTVDVENELAIIGSRGRITVPNDWWNTGYFEAKVEGQEFLKRYSFNFEGNGLRYLLQELMIMIRDRRTECTRFFYEESETLAELLKIIDQRG